MDEFDGTSLHIVLRARTEMALALGLHCLSTSGEFQNVRKQILLNLLGVPSKDTYF